MVCTMPGLVSTLGWTSAHGWIMPTNYVDSYPYPKGSIILIPAFAQRVLYFCWSSHTGRILRPHNNIKVYFGTLVPYKPHYEGFSKRAWENQGSLQVCAGKFELVPLIFPK